MKLRFKLPLLAALSLTTFIFLAAYVTWEERVLLPLLTDDAFESSVSHCDGDGSLPLWNNAIHSSGPRKIDKLVCQKNDKPWLNITSGRVYFHAAFKKASCKKANVIRVDDFKTSYSAWTPLNDGDKVTSLGFQVQCKMGSQKYDMVHHSVPDTEPQYHKDNSSGVHDNIIIIGLDSLSRLEALRSLPASYNFFTKQLAGVALRKYNIIGDGTTAALQAILTGRMEEDWPEARRGYAGAETVDKQDWIFKRLDKLGYLSLWGEEQPRYGTFTYRMLGFKRSPVTFNLRNTLLVQEKYIRDTLCLGSESQSSRMLNNIKELFTLYKHRPKFAFIFLGVLSHEYLDVNFHDPELLAFFKWFKESGWQKNTTVVFMSDHGQRFGPQRNSMQGKLEERLPLMSIALSDQLKTLQPQSQQFLQNNSLELTTPYDIHKTLHSVIEPEKSHLDGTHWPKTYSLITECVPSTRTCQEAKIASHWCTCYKGLRVAKPNNQPVVRQLAEYAVQSINILTANHKQCARIFLDSVNFAEVIQYSTNMAEFNRHTDGSFSVKNNNEASSKSFALSFKTRPNNATYEVTVSVNYHQVPKEFIPLKAISRTNAYGSAPDCIAKQHPYLRPFCFCLEQGH